MSGLYTPGNKKNTISKAGNGDSPVISGGDLSRLLPRQVSTGTMRGTQAVGSTGTKIDSSNNRIIITGPNSSGSAGFGAIPNTDPVEYGLFTLDASGNVITKIVGGSIYTMDGTTVRMIAGVQPDDTVNVAISKTGESVLDAY